MDDLIKQDQTRITKKNEKINQLFDLWNLNSKMSHTLKYFIRKKHKNLAEEGFDPSTP